MPIVLLVEDDPDLRESVQALLEYRGFEVVSAENGLLALEYLREHGSRVGLILLDLMMPVMDGWELRRELLKDPELAAIPVVVLSGVDDAAKQGEALGALACLPKPFRIEKVFELATRCCAPPA